MNDNRQDGVHSNGSWNWNSQDPEPTANNHEDTISDLKNRISLLENEKNDILGQLEQLDNENQENLSKVVAMKEKLQDELNDLKEDYEKLKLQNKNLVIKEGKLKNEYKELKERHTEGSDHRNDEYKEKCKVFAEENQKLKTELEEMKKQLEVLNSSNETVQKAFEEFKVATEKEMSENKNNIKSIESENKVLASHLQNATETLHIFEKKSSEDEDNCQKLAVILETYEKQVSALKEELERCKTQSQCSKVDETESQLKLVSAELEALKSQRITASEETKSLQDLENTLQAFRMENSDLRAQNEELQGQINGRMDIDLEEELEHIKAEHVAQLNLLEQEMEQLRSNEAKNAADEKQIQELNDCMKTLKIEISDLEEQNKELAATHEKVMIQLHDQYVSIITENIKKIQDCEKPSDFQQCFHEDDHQVADFSKQVENIIKILLDLKCKCRTLENKVINLSEEKNNILTDKNHEIEKLMHNSEILSQEVLRKTQAIKEYEKEISDLASNNDLLITDLEAYKSNSVLQTISESNEDNMVLLESQLENANRRIEDLNKIIDNYDKEKLNDNSLQGDEIDSPVQQLKATEDETSEKAADYQYLLNSFDLLQIEHNALKSDLEASRDYLQVINHEKSELESSLEKVRTDYDNLEYQISELNVSNDGLKEEISEYKIEMENLLKENSKMMFLSEEYKESNDELRSRLNFLERKLAEGDKEISELELQVRTLTEKLQISKMAETSLKLHCEQKSKEVTVLSEAKHNLELSLNQTNADLVQFQNNFAELLCKNDKLDKDLEELKEADKVKQEQIRDLEELVKSLNVKLEEYENQEQMKEPRADDQTKNLMVHEESSEKTNRSLLADGVEMEKNKEDNMKQNIEKVTEYNSKTELEAQLGETLNKYSMLQQQFQEITNSRNELIALVTTKHQESIAYHNEIQRLNQILTTENEKHRNLDTQFHQLQTKMAEDLDSMKQEMEKLTDQNSFLKQKCEVLAKNLLEEQSKVQQFASDKSDKEVALQKKLDRLQSHLVELEDHHTQELYQAEQKNAALQARVTDVEEREKNSSTIYTSVSIRANQQIAVEKQIQEDLKREISSLKLQLEESNQGLQAASRLSDQLENSKKTVSTLKDEVSLLQSKLSKADEDLKSASTQTNEKVDKSLVKNLIIGFVTSNSNLNKDQTQILKIIATVLDFNQQEHDKVGLNKAHTGSWLGSFLAPDSSQHNRLSAESLSQAFVRFLENESKPRAVPDLLGASGSSEAATNSRRDTPRQSPIVLSEIVLPTFADFATNRNSSSILKDVLKDNS
ncbi:unnamed protein product [Phaedon cochleariae]|uniref:GRIP domain-containing protein n=1 Tax=Phaedon cochleariae TaxID=80249 RepID=A0A9N9SEF4_PHACE|nr:unnamed protein product [Phaedon cochleariae]